MQDAKNPRYRASTVRVTITVKLISGPDFKNHFDLVDHSGDELRLTKDAACPAADKAINGLLSIARFFRSEEGDRGIIPATHALLREQRCWVDESVQVDGAVH